MCLTIKRIKNVKKALHVAANWSFSSMIVSPLFSHWVFGKGLKFTWRKSFFNVLLHFIANKKYGIVFGYFKNRWCQKKFDALFTPSKKCITEYRMLYNLDFFPKHNLLQPIVFCTKLTSYCIPSPSNSVCLDLVFVASPTTRILSSPAMSFPGPKRISKIYAWKYLPLGNPQI